MKMKKSKDINFDDNKEIKGNSTQYQNNNSNKNKDFNKPTNSEINQNEKIKDKSISLDKEEVNENQEN